MLDNLVVVQYKGGRCGEFLTGYLSQHPGCKSIDHTWDSETNAYHVQDRTRIYLEHLYTVDLELISKSLDQNLKNITSTYYSSSSDQIMETVSRFKQVFLENSAQVVISHSSEHNLFFDCLLMIKHWFKVMPSGKKRWQDEFKNCATPADFLDVTGLGTGESKFNKFLISAGIPVLDLDQMFFHGNYSTWLNFLNGLGITPLKDYETVMSNYHALNLKLAQQYDIPLDIDTDDQWFRNWVIKHG